MAKFQIVSYHDIELNDDGQWFGVNAAEEVFYNKEDDAEFDAKDILKFLKAEKIIASADQRKVTVVAGKDMVQVFEKKGMKPLCRLERRFYI